MAVRFHQKRVLPYVAAISFTVGAIFLVLLVPAAQKLPSILFLGSVALSAWFGGFGPAVLTSILSAAALDYFFLPPRFAFSFGADKLPGIVIFVAVAIMVSGIAKKRSRAESELSRSEERYRAFVENSSEGIWCFEVGREVSTDLPEDEQIDRFYEYAYLSECNDSAARMYGVAKADHLRGMRLGEFLIRSDARNVEYLRAFIRSGYRLTEAESHEVDRKGDVRYFVNNLVGVIENGYLKKAWGTQRDITERRRAEEALQVSEKLASVGRLAATIAHEIRNPLDSVVGIVHLLEQDTTIGAQSRAVLSVAREELGRIAQIAKNTLAFYREAPNPVTVNLCEVLESVLELYERQIRFDNINVLKRFNFQGEVQGFPGELRQVFSNLIRNALEAVGKGGTVVVSVAASRNWKQPERRGVRVLVADAGTGVLPEYRSKLFQPFFSTKGEKGTGVGLWISHGIVRKHGGTIRMRTRTQDAQRGTCFSVFLPIEAAIHPLPHNLGRSAATL